MLRFISWFGNLLPILPIIEIKHYIYRWWLFLWNLIILKITLLKKNWIQSYLQMIEKYSLFHFFWQFWKSKLVTFGELQIITLMFRCQFFKLHRKSTSNFIRIQKILIVWRMSADSLVELFIGIGLSEAKAKDTVKNGNLSKNLEEAITFTQNAQIPQVSQLCFLSCLSHSFTNFLSPRIYHITIFY